MESADWFRTKVDRLYLAVYQTPVPLLGGGTLGGEFLSVVGCWQEDPNPVSLIESEGIREVEPVQYGYDGLFGVVSFDEVPDDTQDPISEQEHIVPSHEPQGSENCIW